MKRVQILLLYFSITVCPLLGQTFFDNYYSVVFDNIQSENVITREDSGYTCVNYILDSATSRIDVNLVWINKSGSHVKNKTLNYFNQSQGNFMQGKNYFNNFTKSSYLLQGTCVVGQMQGLLLSKFNRFTLDTIRTLAYPDPNNNYAINNFVKLHENKYFLIGNKWDNIDSVVILQIDSNLNVIQQIPLNVPFNYGNYNAVYNYHDHKILLGGTVYGPGTIKNALVIIDTLGAISQSVVTSLAHYDNAAQYEFSAFDTTFITYGSKTITPYGGLSLGKLCISKYDKNLTLKWQKVYGQESLQNCLQSMVVENDGSIVSSGAYSETTSLPLMNEDLNGVILKVSKDGYFRWMREFNHHPPGQLFERFFGLDKTKENGYVACGNITNQSKGVVWFVKTDSAGCVTPSCQTSTVQVDSVIIPLNPVGFDDQQESNILGIYPNPTSGNFKVSIPHSYVGNSVIRIKDTLGRVVFSESHILSTEVELKLVGEDGMYFLEILDSEVQRFEIRKIVKLTK